MGKKDGKKEGIVEVAKNMLNKGVEIDKIADITGLSIGIFFKFPGKKQKSLSVA